MSEILDRPRRSAVGAKRAQGRVLPKGYRDDMMLLLYEAGWTQEQIADFTHENVHRKTVGRTVNAILCGER